MEFSKDIPYDQCLSPAFVLDLNRLKNNLNLIKEVQELASIDIIMALKAFANWHLFPFIKDYVSGATASSLNEARLINEYMGVKAHAYFVAYHPKEFNEVLACSSHITFNSISQYNRFKDEIEAHPHPISVGLRVNPEYSVVETDLYNPASPTSRLGMVAANITKWPEGIEGLHFHTLCESSSYDLEKTLQAVEDKFGQFLPQIKWVNMGGGHLMTKNDYSVEHLIETIANFKEKHQVDVILEPGAAFVWQTGELVSEVLDIHQSGAVQTLILDVSFTAHMPDTLEMPYRPTVLGQVPIENAAFRYRLGGLSCLSGDYLEEYGFDEKIKIGDRIVFGDMIHYTTVKSNMFNGVAHPSLLQWDGSQFQLLRSYNYEDYKKRMG